MGYLVSLSIISPIIEFIIRILAIIALFKAIKALDIYINKNQH